MASISLAKIKAAMLAVKPQHKPAGGPPSRRIFKKKPATRGPFRPKMSADVGGGGMLPPIDTGDDPPQTQGIAQMRQRGPVPPGGMTPPGQPPGQPGAPTGPQSWMQGMFQHGAAGGQPPQPGGHAAHDLQIAQGGAQLPMQPPQPQMPMPQQFGASVATGIPNEADDVPQPMSPQLQQRIAQRRPVSPVEIQPQSARPEPPPADIPPQSPANNQPTATAVPSPYAGLSPEEDQFVQQQGATPPAEAAPPSPAEPAAAATAAAPHSAPPSPPQPPGRFQHVIDDTRRMADANRARLSSGAVSGDRATQMQRGIDSAEQRMQELGQRQGFGPDEYKQYLSGQGMPNADAAAEKLFQPGGQMDWYQQASNNVAAGLPQYAGMSSHGPQLAEQLEASRKTMGSAPPGKTEMTGPATASAAQPPRGIKESAVSFVSSLFDKNAFEKDAFLYGRTDSTVPTMNNAKPRTRVRDRFRRLLKLPLPNEPEKAACKLTKMLKRRRVTKKKADAEDPLLARMMNKGKMDKGKAVAIAKSRGWIRQSGRHLELNAAGRGPRNNASKHMRAEAKAAEFVAGLFAS